MKLSIDQKAPDFALEDQDGIETALNSFKNKWLILYFYPKDNTTGCTIEAIDFTQQITEFKKLNASIIGISPDTCKSHQNFIDKQNLNLVLLSDPKHKTLEDYDVWKEKSMYGKKYIGVIRTTFLIRPGGKIVYIWENVKVEGHVNEVKSKLKELQKIS
ncbi:peroxiredoxin [Candidatus Woesearchaeota archaeon]|nr:peroxiredoxin [Candidatus Woesearchaeota archaeon]